MTTRQAARVAVRIAIRRALAELIEDSGPDDSRKYAAARRRLEAAVRRHRNAPVRDFVQLTNAVLTAAPESHRDQVAAALRHRDDAETAELMVEQDIGFAIGVAVGQAFRDDVGWDLISLFDSIPSIRPGRRHV